MKNIVQFSFLLLFCACHSPQQPLAPAAGGVAVNKEAMASDLLDKWNRYHAPGKLDSLAYLYADTVSFFYGQDGLSAQLCLEKTKDVFSKFSNFSQRIDSVEWRVYPHGDTSRSRVICWFFKTVVADNVSKRYDAYLNFQWNNSQQRYQIINEGDAETDENLDIMSVAAEQIFESGDYNGDGVSEKMWLQLEKSTPTINSWSTIHFSDKNMPVLPVEACIGGIPRNEGDLDGDGADEISLIPLWYQSRFTTMRVFTLKNGHWNQLIPGVYCTRDATDDPHFYQKMLEKGDSTFVWGWQWEMNEKLGKEIYVRKKIKIAPRPVSVGKRGISWTN